MTESSPSLTTSYGPLHPLLAGSAPGAPVVPGRPLHELLPVHEGPLTHVWRATGDGDTPLMIHVVREELHALIHERDALLGHLTKAVAFPGSSLHAALWVERLADGRCAYATTWHDRIPAVDAVRDTLIGSASLAETTSNFLGALAEVHRTGCVLGIVAPSSLAYLPASNTFLVDGAGVFHALVAAGAKQGDIARIAGSPAHVAPELLRDEAIVDARADIFSVGTTLYELLTERAPFGGRTTAMMMVSVLVETDTAELEAPGGPVRELVDALLRAIERDPEDRWSSAEAFRAALAGSVTTARFPMPMGVARSSGLAAHLPGAVADRPPTRPGQAGWRAWFARLRGRM